MKREIVVLVMLLAVVAFVGAKGQGEKTGTGATVTAGASLPVTDKMITLKVLTPDWVDIAINNDMPFHKELEKRTNVHLEFQLLPMEGTLDKFNLVMASGDLPDIVGYDDVQAINKFGMQGALLPVKDLIEKYAPNIKAALLNPLPNEKLPYKENVFAEVTAGDGNAYTIPCVTAGSAIGPVWGIRVDWLEKLGLKSPETIDDLYAVLKAFRDKDPNGNGKEDEIPFVESHGMPNGEYVLALVNAFNAHEGLYLAKDGTIKYGPTEQSYKDGITFLHKLYQEGLLDPDYLTTTRDQWMAKTTGNVAGFQFAWPASGFAVPNNGLQKLDSSFRFMPILPVKSASGIRFKDTKSSGNYVQYRTSITKADKYPEITMKYLNYLFTDDGYKLVHFGIEGVHHTMVNGQPIYTDLIMKNPDGLDPETARNKDGLNNTWLPYMDGWGPDFQALAAAPWTIKAWTLYREPGTVEAPLPSLQFTEQELAQFNSYYGEIDQTYVPEMANKFIMGIEPLSKFDGFVAQLKKMKIDEWLKLENAAYTRYQSFGK